MARRTGLVVLVTVLLATALAWPATPLRAQDEAASPAATPVTLGIGEGTTVELLAGASADDMPAAAGEFILERLVLAPGARTERRAIAAPELVVAQVGSVVVVDQFGFEAPLAEGRHLLLKRGATYAVSNAQTAEATLVRLSLAEPTVAPMVTASPVATPPATIQTTVLLRQGHVALPVPPAELVIARLRYAPGADTGPYTHAGPLGLVVEAGTLAVTSPSGLAGQLAPGQGVLLPADAVHREQNAGPQPVTAWLVGVVPAGQPLVVPVAPAPTPTMEPTETPMPTATTEPTPTPEPTATATPMPAGTVLYAADASGGFEEWTVAGPWHLFEGLLVSDGARGEADIFAPYQPPTGNYAVEAEVEIIDRPSGCCYAFGVTARDGTILGGFAYVNSAGVYLNGAMIADADGDARTPDGWHTYRLEVAGNTVRLIIDGVEVAAGTDNQLLSIDAGRAGIHVETGWQLNVRSFRIVAL